MSLSTESYLRSYRRDELALDRRRSGINAVIAETSTDRVDTIRHVKINLWRGKELSISHLSRQSAGHGLTDRGERMEAYNACVHLQEFLNSDVWCDERHECSSALEAGTVHIHDMRHLWQADIQGSFNVVNFCVPQAALDEVADEEGGSRAEELNCPMGRAHVDNVFRNLALALMPALMRPDQINKLFADHAARAVSAHLLVSYGSFRRLRQCDRGGLAPWQERRAKELLLENLSGDIGLSELASACRLSSSHFSQAFKKTVGCPPHKWLLGQRIDCAKRLILNTQQSLAEIALATGFADQSHFTRVFSQWVHESPAAWRRAQVR